MNAIGTAEAMSLLNLVFPDPTDWEYYEWNPNTGIVMEAIPDTEFAELVVRRQPNNDYQTVFITSPS
jgi:hypothetical protein